MKPLQSSLGESLYERHHRYVDRKPLLGTDDTHALVPISFFASRVGVATGDVERLAEADGIEVVVVERENEVLHLIETARLPTPERLVAFGLSPLPYELADFALHEDEDPDDTPDPDGGGPGWTMSW